MALQVIQLHTTAVTGTADDIANFDVPEDSEIVGVEWTGVLGGTGFADGDSVAFSLSFISVSQFTINDARGTVSMFGMTAANITTSGGAGVDSNKWVGLPDGIEVAGGERMHVHALVVGGVDVDMWCNIHLRTKRAPTRRSRRRR